MNKDSVLPQTNTIGEISAAVGGLTKREFYAAMAMQGLLAEGELSYQAIVIKAVKSADALIQILERENV